MYRSTTTSSAAAGFGEPSRAERVVITLRLGLRTLVRNRWRTGLTLAAIAASVGLMVWLLAMYEGWMVAMVRGATAVEMAQVQVHAPGYVDQQRIYEAFDYDDHLLDRVRAVKGVEAISARVQAFGLVGNEARSQVARVLGVDPRLETETTPVADGIVAGRWLAPEPAAWGEPREAVLGESAARQLRVEPGDEVVFFGEAADGSLGNELLRIVGVARTGNMEIDRLSVYMHLEDAQYLTALEGRVHELAIRTADLDAAVAMARAITEALESDELATAPSLVVRPWQELAPEVHQMVLVFRSSYAIMYLMAYLIAAVGIVNTARMSALERRREFGVLLALGMRPHRLFRTVLAETMVLGLLGAGIGALAGAGLGAYHTAAGLDLTVFTDETAFSFMGVAFSDRLYLVLRLRHILEPIAVMLVVAFLSGVWPALKAARIDPAPSIAGRT